ncbi:MAG: YvcK family protein [Clostridiales Family XIII bacterium]|jgi:uncharacterized cofD-like protein|nr:YvcK family protein [Clostridiales Family XIII bacterium]
MTNIVVIGGGTGLSVLLRGIKSLFNVNITAVVSVADDGGSSGVLREDLGMLPPGDVRSCLLALANEEEGMRDLLAYRFSGGRLHDQNVGNIIIAAATEIYGNFEKGIEKISDLLKVSGRVVPVCAEKMTLCAELENGNIVVGESAIPHVVRRENSPISGVFTAGGIAQLSDTARKAIRESDLVIIGPGSLYTSIIPNFLTNGLTEELIKRDVATIYIGNVMTQPYETSGLGVSDHIRVLRSYLEGVKIHCTIWNTMALEADLLETYTLDGAGQLMPTEEDRIYFEQENIELITGNFIESYKGYVRHNAKAVAEAIACRFQLT